ncbi:nuclear transport factor 2 family protein (plasmid) [Streptomyces sp. NBC_00841]|uniref:nuclear transport factor 2 family protein n=1 Tax=unclassified Streptomyces TaxID=2593676 RepID=UPI00225A901D|nr:MULTISPECIES: nuclear transport factor 2 family protein [unclassified Streptomyces]MCX4538189.1 nuclear transport factor 2 family protein [Streptomyces sp. NBC_01669]WSA05332.1 nuclear transport factor 2 family protein [Streptomyces sp. NBC_00841]
MTSLIPTPAPRPDQDPVALVRAAFAALNRHDLDACTRLMTEDFVIDIAGMPFQMRGRDAWRRNAEVLRAAATTSRSDRRRLRLGRPGRGAADDPGHVPR